VIIEGCSSHRAAGASLYSLEAVMRNG
jgi:hypothetical protein